MYYYKMHLKSSLINNKTRKLFQDGIKYIYQKEKKNEILC